MHYCKKCVTEYRRSRWKQNLNYRVAHRIEKRRYDLLRRTSNAHKHGKLTSREIRVVTPTKKCSVCKQTKESKFFSRDRTMPDGLNVYCYDCYSLIKRCRVHGIIAGQFQKMYVEQHGKCAICQDLISGRKIHVDHDHDTGKIRGLLCNSCNPAIGALKHDIAIFRAAIVYLENASKT
jgi:hypothetical protein